MPNQKHSKQLKKTTNKLFTFNNVKLNRIIDGDTIEVDIDLGFNLTKEKVVVRLANINTPESRTRNLQEKKAGLKVKIHLCKMINEKGISSIGSLELDKFGRLLGIVYLNDMEQSINDYLLGRGLANPYYGGTKESFSDRQLDHIIHVI